MSDTPPPTIEIEDVAVVGTPNTDPPVPPPPTPAAEEPLEPVFPEETMVVTTEDGVPVAVVTEPAEEGVAVVDAILATNPEPKQPQEEPLTVLRGREEEPGKEQPPLEPSAKEPPVEEEKPAPAPELQPEPEPVEEKKGGDEVDEKEDEAVLAPEQPAQEPQGGDKVEENKAEEKEDDGLKQEGEVEQKDDVEQREGNVEQKEDEVVPAPEEPTKRSEEVDDIKQKEGDVVPSTKEPASRPDEALLTEEPAKLDEPAKSEEPAKPEESAKPEEPAKLEEPPASEQPTLEPTAPPTPEANVFKIRKRDKVRAKAVPQCFIKIIAGQEIAAAAVFLIKEKSKGVDIGPQLNALMKGGV